MGYLGFGLQRWIYKQKPRKFFERRKIRAYDEIINTGNIKEELIIEGRKSSRIDDVDNDLIDIKERIEKRRKRDNKYGFLIITAIFVIVIIVCYKIILYNDNSVSKDYLQEEKKEMHEAFEMTIEYGNQYLAKRDYQSAVNEFKQAIKIYPNNKKGLIGLADGYYKSCLTSNQYCEEAILQISFLINKYPSDYSFLQKRAEIFFHIGEYEKADSDYDKLLLLK
jgi:tetratricopeptide (TPR) repeat protein